MRPTPEGIRITKVGLWYILITLVVAIAATNTANNALYMVWSVMLAVLVVSGVTSRQNVRGLTVDLVPPREVFANRPFGMHFTLANRGRLLPRWFLLFSVVRTGRPWLLPFLPRRGAGGGELEMSLGSRGRHRLRVVHVASLFPFGLFRKGARYPVDLELLVYPELFGAATAEIPDPGGAGNDPTRKPGWGHDLHGLRRFRQGDDPRAIHWKQTARTGHLIFMQREAEESRRLSIVFDNGAGRLRAPAAAGRFEHLVSEAATAAVDYLGKGYEVELVTRDGVLPFAGGPRQRVAILETLALLEARPRQPAPLVGSDPRAPELRLGMEGPLREATA
jgi:uncharacterized protein (DUF58 family)